MSGNVPSEPVATEGTSTEWAPSDERRALGASVRRLLDVVVQTGASPAVLGAAAAALDDVTESLSGVLARHDLAVEPDSYRSHMSLVGGISHPAAPQLIIKRTDDGGTGEVVVGRAFEGGPGLVHGGVIALLIDHAMGCVANRSHQPAMTVRLSLRYRRPTPICVPLTVAVRLDSVDGRRLHLSASVSAGGEVTVDADAIFVALTADSLERVFSRD
jgi:acyl-coenzyme A thioesterase PaaI-like protein